MMECRCKADSESIDEMLPEAIRYDKWKYYEKWSEKSVRTWEQEINHADKEIQQNTLLYGVNNNPPIPLSILLGFQHFITMFGSTIAVPFLIATSLCIDDDAIVVGELQSIMFFISGVATLIQTSFGSRLPIIQGATFAFLAPTLTILNRKDLKCISNITGNPMTQSNNTGSHDWKQGMREIQGAIIAASSLQVIAGITGLMGFLMKFIGPLTLAPIMTLLGLPLYKCIGDYASQNWGYTSMSVALMIIFSQILPKKIKFLKLFPVAFSIGITWAISMIVDVSKGTTIGSNTRSYKILQSSPWIKFPVPGQWGMPIFNLPSIIGMLAAVLVSILESIANYIACARISNVPLPPAHAINRGIVIEGIGCMLAGLWGSGNGTTSYSENVAAIGVTRVASRRVIQCSAVIMIIFSIIRKFGAIFILIPEPIIGGMFWVLFGLILSVGLSMLQHVNLNSSRNLFVLGFSICNGLFVPDWIQRNSNSIDTGFAQLDQTIIIILSTNMIVGGLTAVMLDNTLPGSKEERGIANMLTNQNNRGYKNRYSRDWLRKLCKKCQSSSESDGKLIDKTYDLPFVQNYLNNKRWVRFLPFLPYHKDTKKVDSEFNSIRCIRQEYTRL